ncbi:hypothetical protein [Micromonospora sp. SH-82]|uniref:hypothetical protein n=1 Tax=Micromonospora sp. SH-82 TaxID=3132938 RepID=UPI003EB91CF0
MGPVIRLGRYRRFTANRTLHLDVGAHRLFVKMNPNQAEAAAEIAGYRRIRDHYRLPILRTHRRIGRWTVSLYDRHQPDHPDSGLLLDALTAADAGQVTSLRHGLDAILQRYERTIAATIRQMPASSTIGKLYRDRARPRGRLDHYYGQNPILLKLTGTDRIRCAELRETTFVINGQPRRMDFYALLAELRATFDPEARVWAAMTQGDPTDFNIGLDTDNQPTWFDYDTGGLNALPGEIACFLWYQRLHGAWLVPRYNAEAFADHRAALATANEPMVHIRRLSPRAIGIDYQHQPSPARRETITQYLTHIAMPLAVTAGTDLLTWLRPYLAMRLLSVYPLHQLDPRDAALSLALLTDLYAPDADLEHLLGLTGQPPTGPAS